MAAPNLKRRAAFGTNRIVVLRVAVVLMVWATWEAAAASGLLYEGIAPSSVKVFQALFTQLQQPSFYRHLGVSLAEIGAAIAIGGVAGAVVGFALGGNRLAGAAYEPLVHYLGPVPKIIILPVLVLMFGVNLGPKIAMGAISCFFPVALSIASGMRQVNRTHINVARTFSASRYQMLKYVYLPSLAAPVVTGLRLGIGLGIIGVLLAETKVAKQGLGFLVIQAYNLFHIADMYAMLVFVFALSVSINLLIGMAGGRYLRTAS
jgi:NitT/TauT family transport system permease protein